MSQQHLLNKDNYAILSKIQAYNLMEEFTLKVSELIKFDHVNDLTNVEKMFFARGYEIRQRIPLIYGNSNFCKEWTAQVPLRPINSQVGLFPHNSFKFVDYYFKKVISYVPGNLRNSL